MLSFYFLLPISYFLFEEAFVTKWTIGNRQSPHSLPSGHCGAAEFAVLFFFLDGVAFVVGFFAVGDAQFELGEAFFEIDRQWDEGGAAIGGF